MILSGIEIKKRMGKDIYISGFDEKRLNPNSYNLRLHNELVLYDEPILDMKKKHKTKTLQIPEEGLILQPGVLYLGRTVEKTSTKNLIPMLEGRSSTGRLGLESHICAGFGDVGFNGYWTLEISVVMPLRIYPYVEICQIYFHTIEGEYEEYKSGKYQNNVGIQSSQMYKDFKK
ncbi:dCTP deaminase (plasmid) [Paenibacillus thiaminolyticus]|uniref:dCTP deaminase n=1 Tax=Paenibacillus thiaminolyticus TaxID=49283 RepID=UPI00232FE495|nr:dCTP deaminase [Paenibacillus thiaminolyticus]WCF11694.1 dCTP deaminase [Paenibacillus thiaminolyticus]